MKLEVIPHCNACGHNYTHITDITIVARDGEDQGGVGIHHNLSNIRNPELRNVKPVDAPGRRNSVMIDVTCEDCGEKSHISLLNHKGQVLIELDGEIE